MMLGRRSFPFLLGPGNFSPSVKLTLHLKIEGWKTNCPVGKAYFQWLLLLVLVTVPGIFVGAPDQLLMVHESGERDF